MKKQKKVITIISLCIFSFAFIVGASIAGVYFFIYKGINFEADEMLFENSRVFESTVIYADGSMGNEYDPLIIENSGALRKNHYALDDISPLLKKGVIAVEDKQFYEHKGVDFKRTFLAAVNLITKKEKVFGASTITQQVIKNISGDNEFKIKRKVEEIIRALHIERRFTKDEILEVYLNIIPMGENIYGVGAAASAYFDKEPADLSAAEAATLIGITNAPTAYSPYLNPTASKKKRDIVLSVMRDDGVINENEYINAVESKLSVIPRDNRKDRFDSWFTEIAIDEVARDLAKKYEITERAAMIMLLGGGYKIYTTMNPTVQSTLDEYFGNLDNLAEETDGGLNYAMTVIDSVSGDLVGIVGRAGKKEGNRLLNHALVPHVPASTLKPIALYAPLIDRGSINWASVFDDVPISFSPAGNNEFPKNSPDIYDGLICVKDALRLSKNTVAVRLGKILTPEKIFDSLKNDFAFDSLIEKQGKLTDIAIAPMALGQLSFGVPLLKLTEAYASFPADGVRRQARSYLYVTDHKDRLILKNEGEEKRVFKESTARIMNQMLMSVTADGTAKSISLSEKIDLAGKTGTSSGNRDKLFVGYTPYFVCGIWCGYDNGQSIESQSKSHLTVWDEVMTKVHERSSLLNTDKKFSKEGLVYMPYCLDSGKEYVASCVHDPRGNRREFGYFSEDNIPVGQCDRHILCLYDTETKAIACDKCPKENLITVSLIKVDDRKFPKEIIVTDAEYVYRDIGRYDNFPVDYALPYFANSIPEGVFVGRSKNKKQFNSGCYIHCD